MSSLPASAAGRCADYATQEDAQAAVSLYPRLDRDHDGVVCESLPHRSGGPASVSAARECASAENRGYACVHGRSDRVGHPPLPRLLLPPRLTQPAFRFGSTGATGTSRAWSTSPTFAGSPEFNLRYGALDNPAFVTLVYKNVLGRTPDQGGLQGSVDFLGRGARRGEVMLGFSESPEFIAKSGVA